MTKAAAGRAAELCFDARSGRLENRDELRLLDAADTVKAALRHAASVAAAISRVEVAVLHREQR